MSAELLEALLRGRLEDPDGGPPLSVPTHTVAIADSLAGGEAELVAGLDLGRRLALVSDVARVWPARSTATWLSGRSA
jgi:hypothetical protein